MLLSKLRIATAVVLGASLLPSYGDMVRNTNSSTWQGSQSTRGGKIGIISTSRKTPNPVVSFHKPNKQVIQQAKKMGLLPSE